MLPQSSWGWLDPDCSFGPILDPPQHPDLQVVVQGVADEEVDRPRK